MGHLAASNYTATSNCVAGNDGCKMNGNGVATNGGNCSTIIHSRNTTENTKSDKIKFSNGDVACDINHNKSFPLNGQKLSETIVNKKNNNSYVEPPHHVDLEDYTRNFTGDVFMGIKFKAPLKWEKIIQITLLHIVFLATFIFYDYSTLNLKTLLFAVFTGGLAGFGVTGGAHRLWTHRAYKAKLPLRIILMLCFSLAGQNTLYDWVRDHRIHHKYSETDADPHNSNRGFFFAHVGWLMMYKHPEVLRRGRQLDMSDILSDPVVQFHQKYFIPLKTLLCFIIPILIPVYGWNETWFSAIATQCIVRYVFSLNFTWSVNSAAHMWGYRPFDKRIQPSENLCVSLLAMGEGWHNYHHAFPWDYKAAELGKYSVNLTTMFLDMFGQIGWAYDMKEPSKELVRRTVEKYGDGTHEIYGHHHHFPEVPDPSEVEMVLDSEIDNEDINTNAGQKAEDISRESTKED